MPKVKVKRSWVKETSGSRPFLVDTVGNSNKKDSLGSEEVSVSDFEHDTDGLIKVEVEKAEDDDDCDTDMKYEPLLYNFEDTVKSEIGEEKEEDEDEDIRCESLPEPLDYGRKRVGEIEDPILYIKKQNVADLTLEEKLYLKQSQQRPDLNIIQKDGQGIRKFQKKWYKTYNWLTGSAETNAVYCFPCLLFGKNDSAWNNDGVTTMKNFVLKANHHASTRNHITCNELFFMLGKVSMDHAFVEAQRISNSQHNEKVTKNRHIIGRLIDVICFLAKQELGFGVNHENAASKTTGNYLALLELLGMEEPAMKDYLEAGTFSDIQNDLIESVIYIVNQIILDELKDTDFVSVQVDETTDVSCRAQISVILRYIYKNEIVERFLGFYDVSDDKTAVGLRNKILEVLNLCQITGKLVAQTHDGAGVIPGYKPGVQSIIRLSCPQAIFVHCYAHHLNLVVLHSCKRLADVKLFICNLTIFETFFARCPLRMEELRKAGFTIPSEWNFHSGSVFSIFKNYRLLLRIVDFVIASDNFDPESINLAIDLNKILKSNQFALMLCLFHKIFVFSDHLNTILQSRIISNPAVCFREIEQTIKSISGLKNEVAVFSCKQEAKELTNKELVGGEVFGGRDFKKVAYEVVVTIVAQMKDRFNDIHNLSFIELLNKNRYQEFLKTSPKTIYKDLNNTYPNTFNIMKLENELSVVYSCHIKNNLDPLDLFNYICDNDLNDVFSETTKFLKLLLTIPITPVSSERSTLKRIKFCLRNSMGPEGPSALATLSIEKEILGNYIKYPNFKDRVIDHFATGKTLRVELLFKKM